MPLHPVISRIMYQAYSKGHASLHLQSVDEVRNHYRKYYQAPKGLRPFEDHQAKACVLRLHRPKQKAEGLIPLVIYLRASGYSIGHLSDSDYYCQCLADATNCLIVAMEPRLTPEIKFPTPIDDCLDGFYYLLENHQQLAFDPNKIALWGDSSGGTYAAVMSQLLKKERSIHQQVLFYPMLDYFNPYPSKELYGKGYMLDNTLRDWFINNLTRSLKDIEDTRVSPVLAQEFKGLPYTTIIGAQYDPMRDETFRYVEGLVAANVPVNAVYFPGMVHGFLWYSKVLDTPSIALNYAVKQMLAQFAHPD
jgi:acetyl esterase